MTTHTRTNPVRICRHVSGDFYILYQKRSIKLSIEFLTIKDVPPVRAPMEMGEGRAYFTHVRMHTSTHRSIRSENRRGSIDHRTPFWWEIKNTRWIFCVFCNRQLKKVKALKINYPTCLKVASFFLQKWIDKRQYESESCQGSTYRHVRSHTYH